MKKKCKILTDRQTEIDILKAICTFLIICIHVPSVNIVGEYFISISRIAVPIFFIITGFFYSDTLKKNGEYRQIKKIIFLILISNALYLVYDVVYSIMLGNLGIFLDMFQVKNLIMFVFFNESPFKEHLWYLNAILYVLLIVLIVDKLSCRKILYIMTPMLLLGDLLLGKYSILFFKREFSHFIVRNFLFVGIPYFSIGCFIKKGFGMRIKKKILIKPELPVESATQKF
ncbi:MAG: acyltransferase family protein [Lachnospiraceae bacterium]|nr:acyltransferase family protein [Lachnospiraceae bacterium]